MMEKGAHFSPDRLYRYVLWRTWDPGKPTVMFTGLNASTADEYQDDPTIRREVGFAQTWGYGGLVKTNIFGARSTDPKALHQLSDPIGPLNDHFIMTCGIEPDIIVLAYGTHGAFMGRGEEVKALLIQAGFGSKLRHLGLTRDGHPRHPLYLRADTPLQAWT